MIFAKQEVETQKGGLCKTTRRVVFAKEEVVAQKGGLCKTTKKVVFAKQEVVRTRKGAAKRGHPILIGWTNGDKNVRTARTLTSIGPSKLDRTVLEMRGRGRWTGPREGKGRSGLKERSK